MRKSSALVASILLLIYLLFWPLPMIPEKWTPQAVPSMTGPFEANTLLANVTAMEIPGDGPEDVAIDGEGRLYFGLSDGRIVRMANDGSQVMTLANTQGRPLGLDFDGSGNLIVADAERGLLSVSPAGQVRLLTNQCDGLAFGLTDDVDVATDGTIYFTDASSRFSLADYKRDGIFHQPHGRLMAYDPQQGSTRLLLDGLYFANGVAVSADQRFVLVNETWTYRVRRYWLRGERKGQNDLFIDNLPGFPDGISLGSKDIFWLAIPAPRNSLLDTLADKPFLRQIVLRLPAFLAPKPEPSAFVLGLDEEGNIIHNFQEPSGKPFSTITSVEEFGGALFFGRLEGHHIGRFVLPH